jgi:hypothetical protein
MPVYGAGARMRGTIERGGPRPRAGRTLERGGTRSREGLPSSGAMPARRERAASNEAEPVRGDPYVGHLDGPSESLWAVSCMVRHLHG